MSFGRWCNGLSYWACMPNKNFKNNFFALPFTFLGYDIHNKKKTNSRGFIKRNKYQKWKRVESRKQNLNLVKNLSDMVVTEPMISLLNLD